VAGAGGSSPSKFQPVGKFSFLGKKILRKSISRTGIFTLKFRKLGWTEQNKVVSKSACILNCNFFMQTDYEVMRYE